MAITHYLLTLLLVLCSSAGDGGLACSATLTILCLYAAHPTGGFLIVGNGVFSMEGLEPEFSISNTPSSQSEELHQQCILPHLSKIHNTCPGIYFPVPLLLLPSCGALLLHTWDQ